jgi:hypothetical protein
MRITVGLDRADTPERIEELHRAGADEFFVGLVPPEWSEHYGWEISPNRRSLGGAYQHVDPAEMATAVAAAQDLGCPVFITLNAHMYGPGQLAALGHLVEICEGMSPAGYIVADPAMLAQLAEWGVDRPMNLSTCAACYNAEHVRWLAEIAPVHRAVLPRKMSFGEMQQLATDLADTGIELEAMVTGYRCFFNDEFCFSWHSGADSMFCSRFVHGQYVVCRNLPDDWKENMGEALANPEEQFREGSALDQLVRSLAAPPCPLDNPPPADPGVGVHRDLAHSYWNHCGLCAIPRLREAGIDVIKSPARGERWRKLRDVQVLRRVVDEPNPTPEFCRELVGSEGFCESRDTCYYAL